MKYFILKSAFLCLSIFLVPVYAYAVFGVDKPAGGILAPQATTSSFVNEEGVRIYEPVKFTVPAPTQGDSQKKAPERFKEGELLVKFFASAPEEKKTRLHSKYGSKVVRELKQLRVHHVKLKKGLTVTEAMKFYRSDPSVEYAEPNFIVSVTLTPNDPYFLSSGSWGQSFFDMWGLHKIKADAAWDKSTGSSDVIVAVSDTGLDFSHPDIASKLWTNQGEIPGNGIDDDGNGFIDDVHGWNFVNDGNNPTDDHGHGTHVSGTIAAVTNNGIGIPGISWHSMIMPVKFLDWGGSGTTADGAATILYAANNGAKVVNCSWGGGGYSKTLEDAINYAFDRKVVVVAAAGNSYADARYFHPASAENVLTVAATTSDDTKASFSNYGPAVEVAAPGVDILSLNATGTDMYGDGSHNVGSLYYRASGTSMAAPHVSGLAALLFSGYPSWTNGQIMAQIVGTTDDIGVSDIGTGRINALTALTGVNSKIRVFYTSHTIDDSAGNGNGSLDPGETIKITVSVKNQGAPLYGAAVTLESSDPYVTITRATASIGDMLSWSKGDNSSLPFELSVSPDAPKLHPISFTLAIKGNSGSVLKYETFDERVSLHLPGWPVDTGTAYPAMIHPVLADFDNDGIPEVVIASNVVHVLKGDGTPMPGWPQAPAVETFGYAALLVEDLDNDGQPEVILVGSRDIYAWKRDGTILPGFPLHPGLVFVPTCGGYQQTLFTAAVVADLDKDGNREILAYSPLTDALHAWHHDGTPVAGWPVVLPGAVQSGCGASWNGSMAFAVGDVDGDGFPEIVAPSVGNKVYAWRHNGMPVAGFPAAIQYSAIVVALADVDNDGKNEIFVEDAGFQLYSFKGDGTARSGWPKYGGAPSFGDIDGDGFLEVVADYYGGYMHVYRGDGSELPGWPQKHATNEFIAPTLGDIDGDGAIDIAIRDGADLIYAWHGDGRLMPEFPLPVNKKAVGYGWPVDSAVTLGDINGDGQVDMVTGSGQNDSSIYAFQMPGAYRPENMHWPTYQNNGGHTGEALKLLIATTTLPDGTVGALYSQTLLATIGVAPYSWSKVSGALPTGVSLDSGGIISGAPVTAGTYTFTIQVRDTRGIVASRTYQLTIYRLNVTTTSLPMANMSTPYTITLGVTGGTPSYNWSVVDGSLPPGMTLAAATGVLSGSPLTVGIYKFTVGVTDSGGASGTRELTLKVMGFSKGISWNSRDRMDGLAVDGNGNIFITGTDLGSTSQVHTIKYDPSGSVIWEKIYDRQHTSASGIAVDSSGYLYVTGSYGYNIFIIKHDRDGNVIWERQYSQGYADYSRDITVDADGNVYVVGGSGDSQSYYRFLTLKYDSAGTLFWSRISDQGTERIKFLEGVAVDSTGNVIVTGNPESSSPSYTIKYDRNGNQLWVRTVAGYRKAVAVDAAGNAYLTGYWYPPLTAETDIFLTKINPSGTILWDRSLPLSNWQASTDITIDRAGNLVVTGYSGSPHAYDFITVQYDTDGNVLWQTTFDSGNDDYAQHVTVDSAGSVYVGGDIYAGSNVDLLILRYDPPRISSPVLPSGTASVPYTHALAATGGAVPYTWKLAAGTLPTGIHLSETGVVSGTPSSVGTYAFSVQIKGSDGVSAVIPLTLLINYAAPQAAFNASSLTGQAPLFVNFTDASSNNPSAWSWSFGDQGDSNKQNPTHAYTLPGTYTVALTVSNPAGSDTKTVLDYITVHACSNMPVRIAGTTPVLYPDFSAAYAAASNNDIIQMHAVQFPNDQLLNRDIRVTLRGGYDCGYTNNAAASGVLGKLQVSNGTAKIENLRFK